MSVGNLAPNSKQKYALRHYTSALLSNQELDSIEVLCKKHMIHPTQLNLWKKEFIANSSVVFEKVSNRIDPSKDDLIQVLYAQLRSTS
jgi:ribosomal protein L16 Arg81 hydroxylase